MEKSRGVIFYNVGHKMLARLSVGTLTCRDIYKGPITLLAEEEGYKYCEKIAEYNKIDIKKIKFGHLKHNHAYLNKCLLHTVSPYDTTIFLDADVVVLKPFDDLFDIAEKNEFVTTQFVNWTAKTRKVSGRLKAWKDIYPDLMSAAYSYPYGLNTGVFAFTKDSKFMADWYTKALPGIDTFIPDEISCQLLLHLYPHKIVSHDYNTSCKFEKITKDTKIVHFHGRKHSLTTDKVFVFNSDLWYHNFFRIKEPWIKEVIPYDKKLNLNYKQALKLKDQICLNILS